MILWSLLHDPLFVLAALPGAAFVFLVPYALCKDGSHGRAD